MKTLVTIFAHPDDESFGIGGTLAKYAHEGVATYYLCGTRGESGTVDPEKMSGYATIGELRSNELECASRELGLTAVHYLDYRDSGMLGSDDNRHEESLFAAATDDVARRIITHIQELKPDVIITHDQFGGYGHPDHIKLHQATLRAYEMLYGMKLGPGDGEGNAKQTTQSATGSDGKTSIPRLYVTAYSRQFLRFAVRLLPLLGKNPRKFGRNQDIDLVQISSWFVPVTARIPVKNYLPYKQRASACHVSQISPAQTNNLVVRLAFRRTEGIETFSRLYPPVKRGERIETELFG